MVFPSHFLHHSSCDSAASGKDHRSGAPGKEETQEREWQEEGGGGGFVHLHVHSQYSLLDGACRTAALVKKAKELGQSAVAITDHGCMFGVVDFYTKAVAEGIKPIIGMEAYMAAGPRTDRTATGVKDGGYHLLLLAENLEGYRNLLKLASTAYLDGFYYKPRIDKEVLRAHSQGLIATSACLGGEIPSALLADNRAKAVEIAKIYLEIFGPERFFIELQKHIDVQDKANAELIDLAERQGIGLVATNDVHFLNADDHAPHDALCCIATGRLLSDSDRLIYPTELYLKSSQQMYEAMDHPLWRQACDHTRRIAAMCNVELNFKASHAPVVQVVPPSPPSPLPPLSSTKDEPAAIVGSTQWFKQVCSQYQLLPFKQEDGGKESKEEDKERNRGGCDRALAELAEAGAIWRYGKPDQGVFTAAHRARLDRELKVIADKNISAYFLIVWDFVNEARRRGIPCNARGSGVGTMLGYCLGLSNACPVKYGLLFERFTDPDRSEYPDIDIDICQDGRQEIIDYVRQKYGHVAQIITFGTLKARAAIRDVGRVLNVPLPEVDKLCKLVGDALGTTIEKALQQEPDLKQLYDDNPLYRQVLETARRVEGLARHAGVHAAGVIVATQPLTNIVPLYKPPGDEGQQIVTQWDGPTCEKVGLLKMDFLGLRTLSIIEKARKIIQSSLSPKTIQKTVNDSRKAQGLAEIDGDVLDMDRLTFDDPKVLDLFRRGETSGVFQFESGGMRNLLVAMKPDRLEDLIAANALYRPGPMDLIPDYCDRKHGRKPVPKVHPIVDQFTQETYGVMVYQEQVMQIVHGLGGIPLRAAYTLIKNISKKKQKDIDAVRPTFVQGAQNQGLSKKQAEELFELILKFAGYGFNKSHSTGYAIVAYQTAYLKTYFPAAHMAAVLTYESVSTDKVVEYVEECRRVLWPDGHRGVEVKAPDINLSDVGFAVVFSPGEARDANHGHIRFGLSAVKGVGDKAIGSILNSRKKSRENESGKWEKKEGKDGGKEEVGAGGGAGGEGGFSSLYDFCERVPLGSVNRATIEALIKCGAFDSLHSMNQRAAMVHALESAIAAGQRAAADRDSGQMNMFGMASAPPDKKESQKESRKPAADATGNESDNRIKLPGITPWTPAETLTNEKSVLGFYISSHPMDSHRRTLETFCTAYCTDIDRLAANVEVCLGGMLTRVKPTMVKNGRSAGQKMAMITLEDATGPLEGVLFSDAYAIYADLLQTDRIVFLKGKVDRRRERPSLIVNQVIAVEQAAAMLTQAVRIRLPQSDGPALGQQLSERLTRLKELLRQASMAGAGSGSSKAEVQLELLRQGQVIRLRAGVRVAVEPQLPDRIAALLGMDESADGCRLIGPAKLAGSTRVLHDGSGPERLERLADDNEFCASIDRY